MKDGDPRDDNKTTGEGVHPTPLLDELEDGPWPSFVTGLKRLRDEGAPNNRKMMNDLLGQLNHSYEKRLGFWKGGTVSVYGYGGGVIPRFSEVADKFPESKEFHTLRVMPPAGYHYTTDVLRKMCDIWERHGSGLIAFHGQSGDIMFQGTDTEGVQKAFDELNELGFDLGGAGPALRTAMSCVGHARCEQSCYDEVRAHRTIINTLLDEMHRPSLPYKFKFKFSGCANDCVNAIHRADFAVIGTWRDDIKIDQEKVKEHIATVGRKYTIDTVVNMCPTRAISLHDDDTLEIDNKSLRALHALHQRDDQGTEPRRRPRRVDPDRGQAGAEDRRPDGDQRHPLHEARDRRGLREADRIRRERGRVLRRQRAGA
ncbi:dissimilatory-type sulfite reductase subunit alpha [Jhaorihella thermophila]